MIGIDSWDNNIPHYKPVPVKNRGKYAILHVIADDISVLDISNMKKPRRSHYFHVTLFLKSACIYAYFLYMKGVPFSHVVTSASRHSTPFCM